MGYRSPLVPSRIQLLVVEDGASARGALERILAADGYVVTAVASAEDALSALESISPDAVVLDLGLPGLSGRDLLGTLRRTLPHAPVVVLTAERDAEVAVECLRGGAYDYLVKPADDLRILTTVARALASHAMAREVARLERAAGGDLPPGLLGASAAFLALLSSIDDAAPGDRSVLVTGEPGSEFGAVARAIHAGSHRGTGPFVAVPCDAGDPGRFLFGPADPPGALVRAAGGTVHLEEVSSLTAPDQGRLEATMAEAVQARVGGAPGADFRVVASSSQDIAALVRAGKFRSGLYFRLATAEVAIPPLRQREGDVLILARHDVAAMPSAQGRGVREIDRQAQEAVRAYGWPGGREELRRTMASAVERAGEGPILISHLAIPAGRDGAGVGDVSSRSLAALERGAVLAALDRAGGNRSAAARELGISRSTLYEKLRDYADK